MIIEEGTRELPCHVDRIRLHIVPLWVQQTYYICCRMHATDITPIRIGLKYLTRVNEFILSFGTKHLVQFERGGFCTHNVRGRTMCCSQLV